MIMPMESMNIYSLHVHGCVLYDFKGFVYVRFLNEVCLYRPSLVYKAKGLIFKKISSNWIDGVVHLNTFLINLEELIIRKHNNLICVLISPEGFDNSNAV